MAIAYTRNDTPIDTKKRLSKTFFGRFLSKKFSPVNFEMSMPRQATKPVPKKSTHAAFDGGKTIPAIPITSHTISPAIGVAEIFAL